MKQNNEFYLAVIGSHENAPYCIICAVRNGSDILEHIRFRGMKNVIICRKLEEALLIQRNFQKREG